MSSTLVRQLRGTRARILSFVDSLTRRQRTALAIGEWSIDDVLRHLIGWDRANRRAVRQIARGEVPDFYGAYDPDWARFNARLVRRYRALRGRALLDALRASHHQLLADLAQLDEREWRRDHGVRFAGDRVTVERLMRVELGDEREHLRQIRDAARRREG